MRDGRAAYRVYDTEAQGKLSEFGGGALGGDINALHPHVYAHYHGFDQDVRTYYASALGLFEGGSNGFYVNQYDWTTGTLVRTLDSATLDNGFGIAHVWPRTNAVFWDAYSGLTYNKIRVWTESDGTSDLISVPNDPTRAASNFGTDEVKIVWQRGSGRIDGGSTFPINDVMVANYATTGAALTGTRLRSDGTEFSTSPFVVGCGYAAHFSNLVPAQVGLLLLRLSDGQAWTLTSTNTASWIWTAPIALTCTELFAIVEAKGDSGKAHTTIARVRLDSLGSGIPPD